MEATYNTITLRERTIPYTLVINRRIKHMRITIHTGGLCTVTVPGLFQKYTHKQHLIKKADWILKKIDYFSTLPPQETPTHTKSTYKEYKEKVRVMVLEKLQHYNAIYNFTYNNVSIKNQKTLWGSCSRQGNLSFNYKLAFLSERQVDYIIVHELCHLSEFNHSQKFWDLVARTIPEYKSIRKEIRTTHRY